MRHKRTIAPQRTKSGEGRTVHLSRQVAETLQRLQVVRKAEALRRGWREFPPWIFVTPRGTRFDAHNVRHAFGRVLTHAKLPAHFTPHSPRQTYASVLISEGKPIVDSLDDPSWRTRHVWMRRV